MLSDLERPNAERDGRDRQAVQRLRGEGAWDHDPRSAARARQVAGAIGRPAAVRVCAPAACPKEEDRRGRGTAA